MCKQIQDRLNTYTVYQVQNIISKLNEYPESANEHSELVFECAIDNLHERLDPVEFARLMNSLESKM